MEDHLGNDKNTLTLLHQPWGTSNIANVEENEDENS